MSRLIPAGSRGGGPEDLIEILVASVAVLNEDRTVLRGRLYRVHDRLRSGCAACGGIEISEDEGPLN